MRIENSLKQRICSSCLQSAMCNLNGLSPAELISRGEEAEVSLFHPVGQFGFEVSWGTDRRPCCFALQEFGGYFIVNGLEKIFRMLILPRRNYVSCWTRDNYHIHRKVAFQNQCFGHSGVRLILQPTCQRRSAWKNRGPLYSEHGVSIRCVREDQSAAVSACLRLRKLLSADFV